MNLKWLSRQTKTSVLQVVTHCKAVHPVYRYRTLTGSPQCDSLYWCLGNWLVYIFITGDLWNTEMPEVIDLWRPCHMPLALSNQHLHSHLRRRAPSATTAHRRGNIAPQHSRTWPSRLTVNAPESASSTSTSTPSTVSVQPFSGPHKYHKGVVHQPYDFLACRLLTHSPSLSAKGIYLWNISVVSKARLSCSAYVCLMCVSHFIWLFKIWIFSYFEEESWTPTFF
jgi:hypothetical protein